MSLNKIIESNKRQFDSQLHFRCRSRLIVMMSIFSQFLFSMVLGFVLQTILPGSFTLISQLAILVLLRFFVPMLLFCISSDGFHLYYVTIGFDQGIVLGVTGYLVGYVLAMRILKKEGELKIL